MTSVRLISANELRANVSFEDLVEPVAKAFQEFSAGFADTGLIVMFPAERPELGDVYVKTGALRGHSTFIVKVSPWFAVNTQRGHPQGGLVGVFDSLTGHTLAILDDEHYLSDIRTAAAGALAARTLAPAQVTTAAVLGAGIQAYWQAQALHRERSFQTLLVWARNRGKAAALAARLASALPTVDIQVSNTIEHTVRRADALITATPAREPLVHGTWLREGQHITAIGADDPTKCELHPTALKRARVFVDDIETNTANGDVHRAIQAGEYAAQDLAGELGEVLAGRRPGRTSDSDITVAKFVGIGVLDLIAAEISLAKLGLDNVGADCRCVRR